MRRVYALEIYRFPTNREAAEADLLELRQLIRAAGLEFVDGELHSLRQIHTHSYIGPGKLEKLKDVFARQKIDLIVLDAEIKPYQIKNIEDFFNIEVADRTRLILEIFKQRAHSKEGKLQVALAEAEYEIGRQIGQRGVELSGLGKGVRGPGEHIAEKQRRAYRRKIKTLRDKLEEVKKVRTNNQTRRAGDRPIRPLVSLVGYTNAGKSTLLNALVKQNTTTARDQLFTTVDPTTRQVFVGNTAEGKPQFVYVTDTVGFIRKLPHELVEGFESTLDMVNESDLVLVVVDISDPTWSEKQQQVIDTLDRIGCKAPIHLVYNKIDQLEPGKDISRQGFPIAAASGDGVEALKVLLKESLLES